MPIIKSPNNIEWNYEVEGSGPILLFIHGWGVDSRIWRQQIKHFSSRFQVVVLDLPGHGKTIWQETTLDKMAEDIIFIHDALKWIDVSAVGSSLGGFVALKVLNLAPGLFKKLILVGALPKFSKSSDWPYGIDTNQIHKLCNQLNSDYPSIVNVFFRSLFTRQERESRRFKWLQRFRQNIDLPQQEALFKFLGILEKEDMRPQFEKLNVPLLFIQGTGDNICPKEIVSYFMKVQPSAKVNFFKECGHFPFLSKPYEFNAAVEEFLSS